MIWFTDQKCVYFLGMSRGRAGLGRFLNRNNRQQLFAQQTNWSTRLLLVNEYNKGNQIDKKTLKIPNKF